MNLIERLGNWQRFHKTRSRALGAAIEALILEGGLPLGTALPAERIFAAQLGVSRTLVISAYATLREAGWLTSRQGSATRIAKLPPGHVAATHKPKTTRNPMSASITVNDAVIDLSIACAVPDAAWLTLSPATRGAVLTEHPYQPQGLLALRQRIAARLCRQGITSQASQILVTSGAQQAIALLAARYASDGRHVLVEQPTYFGAIDCLRSAGARLVPVNIARVESAPHNERTPRAMIEAVAAGGADMAYVCPTNQNPTGLTWTASERRALALAAARSGTLVVIDDSLSELAFHPVPPSPAHYCTHAPIVTINGLGKTLWSGLRIGWLRADDTIVSALTGDRLTHDLGGGTLGSAIACDLLDHYDKLLNGRCVALQVQRDACIAALRQYLPQWRFAVPDGGMFLWVRVPGLDSDAFARHALTYGVLIAAGSAMTVEGGASEFLRISYAQTGVVWMHAAQRLKQAWESFGNLTLSAQQSSTNYNSNAETS